MTEKGQPQQPSATSSDRFHCQPKSLRKRSGKKAGGQPGHPGSTLRLSSTPDRVMVHLVEGCQHCQRDLHQVVCLQVECRQVCALPPKRLVVNDHQAQQKCCPSCQQTGSLVGQHWAALPKHRRGLMNDNRSVR